MASLHSSSSWLTCSLLCIALIQNVHSVIPRNAVTDVHVSMTANFDTVPLVFEIAEFFHHSHSSQMNPNLLYFQYIDEFIGYYHNDKSSSPSQQDIYQWTLSTFSDLIGTNAMQSLEMALSLHHYTPRMAMFEQLFQSMLTNSNPRHELVTIQTTDPSTNPLKVYIDCNPTKSDEKCLADSLSKMEDAIQSIYDIGNSKTKTVISPESDSNGFDIFKMHDHWIGDSCFNHSDTNSVLVVYFGDYLSSTFKTVYSTLSAKGRNNDYCFVLRPISLKESHSEFTLQGYGVELAIKNMEYKVMDDRNIASVEIGVDGEEIVNSKVDDMDHDTDEHHHQIHEEVIQFLDSMDRNDNVTALLEMEEEAMKTYMSSLDIQATKALLDAFQHAHTSTAAPSEETSNTPKGEKDQNQVKSANKQFLSLFREFSTNFPRYVSGIAHIPKDTYQYLLPYLQTMQRYQREGQQGFAVNGVNLATDDFDVFNFYDTLRKEAKFVDALNNIMKRYDADFKHNRLLTKLLATPFEIGTAAKSNKGAAMGGMMGMFGMGGGVNLDEEDVRIDMRDSKFMIKFESKNVDSGNESENSKNKESSKSMGPVLWTNNIEKDSRYREYYNDLKGLRSFMVMQQVVPIRRNMYNGVAIFDPVEYSGYSIFGAMQNAIHQRLPLRLGFILYPRYLLTSTPILTTRDEQKRVVSERIMQCVCWLVEYSKSGNSARRAGQFLTTLYDPIVSTINTQLSQKQMAEATGEDTKQIAGGVDDEVEEKVDTLPTLNMVEEAILDMIKGFETKSTTQEVLDAIYTYDIAPYLEMVKSFVADKGISTFLDPIKVEVDADIASTSGESVPEEHYSGCLLALNGRIFPHILGSPDQLTSVSLSVYTLVGIMMEEQRNYLMSYATDEISKKTNFNDYVYQQPDVLARFSPFVSWLGTAGTTKAIKTNAEITDKAKDKVITLLHPKQIENPPKDIYWSTLYTGKVMGDTDESKGMVPVITVWLVVDVRTVMGRVLVRSFSKIDALAAEYGVDPKEKSKGADENEDTSSPFGIRFAVLFNSEDSQLPIQCITLKRASCIDDDGKFSWRIFRQVASDCAAVSSSHMSLKTDADEKHTEISGFITGSLGLAEGGNYIVMNGEVIPLDHLYPEDTAGSTPPAVEPITPNDIWTLITRYHEETEPIMKTLFNEDNGIYSKECGDTLNTMVMEVVSLLYWRRLHESFWASASMFSIAARDEKIREVVDSLSVSLYQDDEDGAPFSVRCVLDPLSPQTQRIVSFIDELYDYHGLFDIEILFNPTLDMKDEINKYGFPKKLARYYRYVFNPNGFVDGVSSGRSDRAVFANMPTDDVLTMAVTDTPGMWLYESLVCKYDLDNLLLSSIDGSSSSVLAVNYHLTKMLIQGQCFDEKMQPVPGLQLELKNHSHVFDATIAMQTLGYWQLKANPGVWELGLREGRTTEVMMFDSNKTKSPDLISFVDNESKAAKAKVVLNAFSKRPLKLRTKHKEGMEKEELLPQMTEEQIEAEEQRRLKEKEEKRKAQLEKKAKADAKRKGKAEKSADEKSSGGILDSVKSAIFGAPADSESKDKTAVDTEVEEDPIKALFGRKREKYVIPTPETRIDIKPAEETTIHVMSVASGHLYERFLKVKMSISRDWSQHCVAESMKCAQIMMITTLRNTKAGHVKFWFLKQFLSPRFREFIPHFEKQYNCSIELVEYRWPEWLRKQTEKQRIIWAYKILFLDVLFPLDLERIIFVDADQVVRGDLLDLWNLDLQGKPYAYTPFGATNLETEGFRFWKSGYWSNHLRGKPYHISALYVVDLATFRRKRAGDSLRVIYEQLSADPNSLANLDQDLPNFAQHGVPIYSLPKEWLWCETWCIMEELETAKSIDLCNNPLTKEPKIDKAKRMLSEWSEVDDEATKFENELIEKGLITV